MRYYDAHLHLQDPRLEPVISTILPALCSGKVSACIVNGTSPRDWDQVSKLATDNPGIRPAFGLHPWKVGERGDDWFEQLQSFLGKHEGALIGEIGLDKWIRDPQFEEQLEVFQQQLSLAAALEIPPTIHCLKAWGHLLKVMDRQHSFLPGFLLHAHGGPVEMVENFVEMGAYFSISGYFARPEKVDKLEAWKRIPLERILVETDAPDMLPPEHMQMHKIFDEHKHPLNHPGNIVATYEWAAGFFGFSDTNSFSELVENNYTRLFGRTAR